ncbi:MAG TPA: SWIM zinc finger family protein [Longimicrobiaceae bacterium]|nr:SWIM zinc finger family protein [Longimicrobiaceae bacterium]
MAWPPIDFAAAGGVDPARLERGVTLHAVREGPGRYRVTGGDETHWVDLRSPHHPRCDCGDHLWRDRVCKHMLAALLREGDERVLVALAALVRELRTLATPPRPPRRRAPA